MIAEAQLRLQEFALFRDLIYREAGIRLPESKRGLVQSRLRARVLERSGGDYGAYHRLIRRSDERDELQRCIDALTTNETFFFRHKTHWDHLAEAVLPAWCREHGPGAVFRAWSAACSTGEEPYSLAILLLDSFGQSGFGCEISATDINATVLERARAGIYGPYALQKVTPACRAAYFEPAGGDRHRVCRRARDAVRFSLHNLQQRRGGPPCDLILLRNVMIYFDEPVKARVLSNITAALRPGGHLILGGAESLGALQSAYHTVRPTIYRKR